MKFYIFTLGTGLFFFGCAGLEKTTYSKLEKPFQVEATRNYLPNKLIQPAYTIYEGTVWACDYKTDAGDPICCRDTTIYMGNWKYCLLLDDQFNGFAFFELGTSEYLKWSEGKQQLFRKVDTQQ